jgi:F0F1-type ATP synthase epsilon subunit
MMNRVARRCISTTSRVLAEAEAAAADSSELRLNLAVPARALISDMEVARVTLPGRAGKFGVEKSSPPMVAELKPGVVHVLHTSGSEDEFFVPGGFAFIHGDNRIDVSTPEGVRLEDIDAGESSQRQH